MIISAICPKGGVGRTTTVIALASAAEKDNRKVYVYDAGEMPTDAVGWARSAAGEISSFNLRYLIDWRNNKPLPFPVKPYGISLVKAHPSDSLVFIDTAIGCPEEIIRLSDFIVIPTSVSPADVPCAESVAQLASEHGKDYGILLAGVKERTRNLERVRRELSYKGLSFFDSVVYRRDILMNYYGNAFGDNLYGYAEVYRELIKGVSAGAA